MTKKSEKNGPWTPTDFKRYPLQRKYSSHHWISSAAWKPDGRRIAVSIINADRPNGNIYNNGVINIYDVTSRNTKPTQILIGHSKAVTSLAWSQRGKRLISGSFNKTVKVWNIDQNNCQCKATLNGHKSEGNLVQYSSDEKLIASASYDGKNPTIIIWQTKQPWQTTNQPWKEIHRIPLNHVQNQISELDQKTKKLIEETLLQRSNRIERDNQRNTLIENMKKWKKEATKTINLDSQNTDDGNEEMKILIEKGKKLQKSVSDYCTHKLVS